MDAGDMDVGDMDVGGLDIWGLDVGGAGEEDDAEHDGDEDDEDGGGSGGGGGGEDGGESPLAPNEYEVDRLLAAREDPADGTTQYKVRVCVRHSACVSIGVQSAQAIAFLFLRTRFIGNEGTTARPPCDYVLALAAGRLIDCTPPSPPPLLLPPAGVVVGISTELGHVGASREYL